MRRVSLSIGAATVLAGVLGASSAHAQQAPPDRFDPKFVASFGGGAGGWARGMFDATWPGFTWQGRLGLQLYSWLAIDGTYYGQFNAGYAPVSGPSVGVVNQTLYANVRLIVPTPLVQPYAMIGFGGSFTNIARWEGSQSTHLQPNVTAAMPLGLGVMTQLSPHWGVSAEGGYQRHFGEHFSTVPAYSTGDIWSGILGITYRM